ncbi:MAG: NHL repeat-containing protein [Pirellulales bacterium]
MTGRHLRRQAWLPATIWLLAATAVHAQSFVISTVAGVGRAGFSGDGGPAAQAELNNPSGVAVGADGSLVIADLHNQRVRKIDPRGVITTIAGDGTDGSAGDGGPAVQARLSSPYGVAVDRAGNVLVGDRGGYSVRKISPDGTISRFAGTGQRGYSGDGGPAVNAELTRVNDMKCDAQGNVYIADTGNHCIRVVDAQGTIKTVAGTGEPGYSGDGGLARTARFNAPSALCLDAAGALYVCDFNNHCVRKVTTEGIVSTIAGTGKAGWGGDDKPATTLKLFQPCGVAVDAQGQVYIADSGNSKIRVVRSDGTMGTVTGTGKRGYAGDGGPANKALIAVPDLIDIDAAGNLYIAEYGSHVIRKLTRVGR